MGGWMQRARAYLSDVAPPIILAIMFWSLAGLAVVLAMGASSNSHLANGIAAFGAFGQVVMAFLVWRLTRTQMNMSNLAAERALRAQLYPLRTAVIERFQTLAPRLIQSKINDDALEDGMVMYQDIAYLYSTKTMDDFADYLNHSSDLLDMLDEQNNPNFVLAPPDAYQIALKKKHKLQMEARFKALNSFVGETRIQISQ